MELLFASTVLVVMSVAFVYLLERSTIKHLRFANFYLSVRQLPEKGTRASSYRICYFAWLPEKVDAVGITKTVWLRHYFREATYDEKSAKWSLGKKSSLQRFSWFR